MSLESDIKKMVESIGLSLYDTAIFNENENTIFRVSVTAPGGVTLDKCVEATHLISPLLDVTSPVSGDYRLEVSSPGIERKLKTLEHFVQSVGEKVALSTISKEKYEGEMVGVENDEIILNTKEDGEKRIPFRSISKAKTYFEW
ncbi:MAG: ribosome maturation factor RimP [Sulfuricurvum sp.]|uniref:ribosome maturation factor RimP n=1 Tax=Sulfuricurvum sp. TaxID=2025608 RepID=UPI0026233644|nr:ribosome maturation factor RimP [Sulfuricurvum sp.]MDD2368387.1 ribosome maturation factor RimP [Sulfuricurvum sp.]MDD2949379.1 ribosome maturation factor RimP [Sulfuricurvum sp.]MDD5118291.1 ribosome maturation factor RimP [Sulfuricurvum sp.]